MTRPTGVTILGILGIIGGGLFVFLAMLLLLGSAFVAHRALGMPGFLVGMGAAALGVFVGGLGSLYLIAGVGLLRNL